MKKDSRDTLLALWRAPTNALDPVGCLGTTFTFDPGFYEEECLSRFLGIGTLPDQEGLAYILERDSRLGEVYAGVMVDQHNAGVDHSMRWDVLPVRIRGGFQHAKLSVLAWTNHVRIIISSANLTPSGYRTNQEITGVIEFPDLEEDRALVLESLTFIDKLMNFVPGADRDDQATVRAKQFISQLRQSVNSWKATHEKSQSMKRHFVYTMPGYQSVNEKTSRISTLNSAVETLLKYGHAPSDVKVYSPFFDIVEDKKEDSTTVQLCKSMSRKAKRSLTFCVPALIDNSSEAVRLAAPRSLYRTAKKRADKVTVEALPLSDDDKNRRAWHAKMLYFMNNSYYALLLGSSNYTSAGMGLHDKCNVESNLMYIAKKRAFAQEKTHLAACLPETTKISNPEDAEWEKVIPELEVEGGGQTTAVIPSGFITVTYRAGKQASLIFQMEPSELPDEWKILAGGNYQDELVNALSYSALSNKRDLSVPWRYDSAPGKLCVSWAGSGGEQLTAFWVVNVEDERALQLPSEISSMTDQDLMAILAAADRSAAFRCWVLQQKTSTDILDLDYAMPVELDPLAMFSLSDTFLHRVRRRSILLEKVRKHLERPVWSEKALVWRLYGVVGIKSLADKICSNIDNSESYEKRIERVLELADFLIMLNQVHYQGRLGFISKGIFNSHLKKFKRKVANEVKSKVRHHRRKLPPDITSFIDNVLGQVKK